jgi:hypothetical protein
MIKPKHLLDMSQVNIFGIQVSYIHLHLIITSRILSSKLLTPLAINILQVFLSVWLCLCKLKIITTVRGSIDKKIIYSNIIRTYKGIYFFRFIFFYYAQLLLLLNIENQSNN